MATLAIRPNGAGDLTEIDAQSPNTGEHWDKVDEADPHDSDDTTVHQPTVGASQATDLYNLESISDSIINITNVTVYATWARQGGAVLDPKFWIKIKTGGTIYTTPSWDNEPTSYTTRSYAWATNPQSGVTWIVADINALQAGIMLERVIAGGVDPYGKCTQVYVVITYAPFVPKIFYF